MSDNSKRFTYKSASRAMKMIHAEIEHLWKDEDWPEGCEMTVRLVNQAANTARPYRRPSSEQARRVTPHHTQIVVNVRGVVTVGAWMFYDNEDSIFTFNDVDSHGALINDREVYRYGVNIYKWQDVKKVIKALDQLFLAQNETNGEESVDNTPQSP